MKIIKASATIIDIAKMAHVTMMELAGRLCYRSEDKITLRSAITFICNTIKKRHWSVTEFAIFTLRVQSHMIPHFTKQTYKYLTYDIEPAGTVLITGTARGFREAPNTAYSEILHACIHYLAAKHPTLFDDIDMGIYRGNSHIKELSVAEVDELPVELKKRHRWVMVRYIVNRAVSHELVRHRPVSWLQESQRYCAYATDKFGNEVTFIDPRPAFPMFSEHEKLFATWQNVCKIAEIAYLSVVKPDGLLTPQAARTMLPNSCKTELVQLCNLEEWAIFFGLRTTKHAEPSMREVTIPLYAEFQKQFPEIFIQED